MKKFLFSRNLIGLGVVIGTFAALPLGVASAAPAPSTPCPGEDFSQPFLSFGDDASYTLAPGESADSFDGTGWILNGGASIVTTTLDDGSTGQVLDLPAGSSAVSPAMCVSTGYRGARMMTQVVAPPPGKPAPPDGHLPPPKVTFTTSVVVGPGPDHHTGLPGKSSWELSHRVPVAPGNAGDEQVQFTFSAKDDSSELQVYNLYVDPRML
jgi:hypothetical protein